MKRVYEKPNGTMVVEVDQTHEQAYQKATQTLADMRLWNLLNPDDKIPTRAQTDPDARYKSNLLRMRRKATDIIESNVTEHMHFVTLTYAENMQDYDKAWQDMNYFVKLLRKKWADFEYLGTKELQARGAIHFHLIVFGSKRLNTKTVKACWPHGFVKTKPVTDVSEPKRLARYLTKYITKEEYQRQIKSKKKMLLASRHLKRTKRIKGQEEEAWRSILAQDITPNKATYVKYRGFVFTYDIPQR
jgi:hypothetical protein